MHHVRLIYSDWFHPHVYCNPNGTDAFPTGSTVPLIWPNTSLIFFLSKPMHLKFGVLRFWFLLLNKKGDVYNSFEKDFETFYVDEIRTLENVSLFLEVKIMCVWASGENVLLTNELPQCYFKPTITWSGWWSLCKWIVSVTSVCIVSEIARKHLSHWISPNRLHWELPTTLSPCWCRLIWKPKMDRAQFLYTMYISLNNRSLKKYLQYFCYGKKKNTFFVVCFQCKQI